jgi:glycosyltransferase involved in cell wall biosynthesis
LDKHIHIITLDVPYPANYGGAIDAFYAIKNLHALGTSITLHCFTYNDRIPQSELNKYCNQVYYYPRQSFLKFLFSKTPFIIASRKNDALLQNLLKDNSPILFEALHTSVFVNHPALAFRKKVVRTLNIESDYYHQLAKHENKIFKKLYYSIEAKRLLQYEQTKLSNTKIASIAMQDNTYFQQFYKPENCTCIAAFHPFENLNIKSGLGEYCLYHGNLGVAENNISAQWLIENIFSKLTIPLIIAGNNPSNALIESAKKHNHISIVINPNKHEMNKLISDAQIHVLPSFQNTGLKLKLLHALFTGRHCIVNTEMLTGTNLASICSVAENNADWKEKIEQLFLIPFSEKNIENRKIILKKEFDVQANAEDLLELIINELK